MFIFSRNITCNVFTKCLLEKGEGESERGREGEEGRRRLTGAGRGGQRAWGGWNGAGEEAWLRRRVLMRAIGGRGGRWGRRRRGRQTGEEAWSRRREEETRRPRIRGGAGLQ